MKRQHALGKSARRTTCALILGACLASGSARANLPGNDLFEPSGSQDRVELMALTLNGVPRDDAFFLVGPDEGIYASQALIDEYGLDITGDTQKIADGEVFRPLSAVAGAHWQIVASESRLILDVPAASIRTVSEINIVSSPSAAPPSRSMGAFLNYDLLAFGETPGDDYSMAFETGTFGAWGVATNDFIVRNASFGDNVLRLESTLQYDRPASGNSLRLGDTISRPDAIGNAVRFAGVQYGTNFATQPYFLTFPQPTLTGRTSLPSTVDVYIDNVLRGSQDVPAGGFSTQALPISAGRGQVRLQVRDALGRQTVITRPFFITNQLLKPGLSDFSLSAGVLRENFALESNNYGQALVNGLWRHGFTDRLTFAVFSSAQPRVQTAGTSATVKLAESIVAQGAVAGSYSDNGGGVKARLGINQQLGRLSYGAAIEQGSQAYRPVGAEDELFFEARQTVSANLGLSLGGLGSLTGNYIRREFRQQGEITILNVNFTRPLGPAFLSAGVFQTRAIDERGYAGQVLLTLPLGARTTASTGAALDDSGVGGFAQLQRALPIGPGYGYRLQAGSGDTSNSLAEVAARSNYGSYRLAAAQFEGRTSYQAEISGGIAAIGGGLYASRRLDDSFALVDVPDFDNVRIYDQNQLLGRTNGKGRLLVPRLLPYQANTIRVDPADLPLDARIPDLSREAVPYFRSGTVTRFDIQRAKAATFVAVDPDGEPLMPGIELVAEAGGAHYPIGYEGFAYVSDLHVGRNVFLTDGPGDVCRFVINYPQDAEIQPDLGIVRCERPAP